MIRDLARKFVRDEVLPLANKLDPEKGDIPRELIDKMGELGFFSILIPEQHGGLGLGAFEYCLVAEELARGWMSVASIIARGNGFYKSIPGTPEEISEKASRMAKGRSEEHTSELQSLMRISYAVFCLQKKNKNTSTKLTYNKPNT